MAQTKPVLDKLLGQASKMHVPDGYISELALPAVKVKQKTGKLAGYGTNHLRIETTISGGRGEYRRVDSITRSTDTYSVESHGLEDIVTEDDYDNVEAPYEAEEDAVIGLTSLIWLRKEKGFFDAVTSTSNITQNTTLSGTAQHSDYANSDPLDDFKTARSSVKSGCGVVPNCVMMGWDYWNIIRFHPQMLDALGFKDNRPGGLSEAELAIAMGVKKVLISKASYESAVEGQTSSLADVWTNDVVFAVCPDSAMKRQVSLGYRVQLSSRMERRVIKYPIYNPPNATGIIVDDHYDQLLSNVNAAYLIEAAV